MQRPRQPDVWGSFKSQHQTYQGRRSQETGECQARMRDKQAETIEAARHQNLLLPQVAQVEEIKEDAMTKKDAEATEALETLAATRGDRIPQ